MFSLDNNQIIIKIKRKLDVMTRSQYRTTNFSIIELFSDNNFQPINIKLAIIHLVSDYKSNPKKYVLSRENSHYKSEKTFEKSIRNAINKNKSFEKGPGDGFLSLNLIKALEYLDTMYNKYKSNSKDIKTPIKLSKKNKEYKRQIPMINFKREKSEDDSDYDINSRKWNKLNNYDFHSPEKAYHQRRNIYQNFRNEKGSQNSIFSIRDSDSDTYPSDFIKKEEVKEEELNSEWIPDIFSKDLIKINLTSSLDTKAISDSVKDINNYLQYNKIFEEKISEDEEIKKLEEIKNYLKKLYENKNEYNTISDEVKIWQKEIYYIFKVMQSQLNAIKIEINNKTYCYDSYIKLRDIILNYEQKYNIASESLMEKLNEINNLEKNSVEKQSFIKWLLSNININNITKKLINLIENAAKINDYLPFNQKKYEEFPNFNSKSNLSSSIDVDEIMENLNLEKMRIINSVNEIDDEIGNISI